jgi:hypothetical protein
MGVEVIAGADRKRGFLWVRIWEEFIVLPTGAYLSGFV